MANVIVSLAFYRSHHDLLSIFSPVKHLISQKDLEAISLKRRGQRKDQDKNPPGSSWVTFFSASFTSRGHNTQKEDQETRQDSLSAFFEHQSLFSTGFTGSTGSTGSTGDFLLHFSLSLTLFVSLRQTTMVSYHDDASPGSFPSSQDVIESSSTEGDRGVIIISRMSAYIQS